MWVKSLLFLCQTGCCPECQAIWEEVDVILHVSSPMLTTNVEMRRPKRSFRSDAKRRQVQEQEKEVTEVKETVAGKSSSGISLFCVWTWSFSYNLLSQMLLFNDLRMYFISTATKWPPVFRLLKCNNKKCSNWCCTSRKSCCTSRKSCCTSRKSRSWSLLATLASQGRYTNLHTQSRCSLCSWVKWLKLRMLFNCHHGNRCNNKCEWYSIAIVVSISIQVTLKK